MALAIGDLEDLHLSGDGTRLYVAIPIASGQPGGLEGLLLGLDPTDLHVLSSIPVAFPGLGPGLLFQPTLAANRGRLYSVTPEGSVAVEDAATGALVADIPLPPEITQPVGALSVEGLVRLLRRISLSAMPWWILKPTASWGGSPMVPRMNHSWRVSRRTARPSFH